MKVSKHLLMSVYSSDFIVLKVESKRGSGNASYFTCPQSVPPHVVVDEFSDSVLLVNLGTQVPTSLVILVR